MQPVGEKNYLELMRDLAALRRSRADGNDDARCERDICEHEAEVQRRDRHGR